MRTTRKPGHRGALATSGCRGWTLRSCGRSRTSTGACWTRSGSSSLARGAGSTCLTTSRRPSSPTLDCSLTLRHSMTSCGFLSVSKARPSCWRRCGETGPTWASGSAVRRSRRSGSRPGASVVIATDNAGRELLADLVLIDHLLQHGHASAITLHVKPCPYYVSDVTTADVLACLRRLASTPGSAAAIARRVHAAMAEGRLGLYTHEFYCAPWSYRRMPADLASQFERASLTIFKGDLHYRRLVGDRDWPAATPFADVASYFPGPVAVLRT